MADRLPRQDTSDPRAIRSLSPEARKAHAQAKARRDTPQGLMAGHGPATHNQPAFLAAIINRIGPGTRLFEVVRRTAAGTYNDGFTHAGNLAYLALLGIFPFFILSSFLLQLILGSDESQALVDTVLAATPPAVREAIGPVAITAIEAREGWLLWLGAGVGLWTVSSLIESIRDILRRAYGTSARHAFWKYRLFSAGLIIAAVVVLMASLFAQVAISTAMQVIDARLPQLAEVIGTLQLTRIVPALAVLGAIYVLFLSLTPEEYRRRDYPKWPGAVFTSVWWVAVTMALPPVLSGFFTYDLTYGSLAGIMIALFFFWLVGLGLVIGAELNAALTEPDGAAGADDTVYDTSV